MTYKFFLDKRPHNALTYQEYMNQFIEEVENPPVDFKSEEDRKRYEHKKLNLQRSKRIEKYFSPSDELRQAVSKITEPQLWMMITESWCGDSAQNIPYFAKTAELNPLINFRIILRDTNADIMDNFLTNGTRSIPKLVVFNESGDVLFDWGPRPKPALNLFRELKEKGLEKKQILDELHLWYGRNKGQAVQKEIIGLLNRFIK
ncbi:MAG: thioredoxin family protein [Ignavibacteriaceae bacterium]|nr:thioredoxin family protein [Ignavibacteriaceae bacterium]